MLGVEEPKSRILFASDLCELLLLLFKPGLLVEENVELEEVGGDNITVVVELEDVEVDIAVDGLVLVTVNLSPPPELPCLIANWSPGGRDFDLTPSKAILDESAFLLADSEATSSDAACCASKLFCCSGVTPPTNLSRTAPIELLRGLPAMVALLTTPLLLPLACNFALILLAVLVEVSIDGGSISLELEVLAFGVSANPTDTDAFDDEVITGACDLLGERIKDNEIFWPPCLACLLEALAALATSELINFVVVMLLAGFLIPVGSPDKLLVFAFLAIGGLSLGSSIEVVEFCLFSMRESILFPV